MDLAARRAQLRSLIHTYWEAHLARHPEFASEVGDRRFAHRLIDHSAEAHAAHAALQQSLLTQLEALSFEGFTPEERLDHKLLLRMLREAVAEAAQHPEWLLLHHVEGPHLDLPELVEELAMESEADVEAYVARLRAFPRLLTQAIERASEGAKAGVTQPASILARVAAQAADLAEEAASPESPFLKPLEALPAMPPEAEARLRGEIERLSREEIAAAYAGLQRFVEAELMPAARTGEGVWSLPDGEARYALAIARHTTTAKTAQEIHAVGLAEVARLEAELNALAHAAGHPDHHAYHDAIHHERHTPVNTREEMLEHYRQHTEKMAGHLPRLFGRLPQGKLEVRALEGFREAGAPGGEYEVGTPDGQRPGCIRVNTSLAGPTYDGSHIEATAYHEGIPGHHLQLALAQEMTSLSPFRQHADYVAFVEGWALYAESLAKELGMYDRREANLGRLDSELFRAARLVVDTGLHALRWTRAQAIEYFRKTCDIPLRGCESEVDRYLAWPGQALGYKVGQLELVALRERARARLGARFDLKDFHDRVLGGGALPLDLLEEELETWLAEAGAR
jgi:uncharacterized protein (DUF885 family)